MFRTRVIGAVLVVAAALAVAGGPNARASGGNAHVVIEWNAMLQATIPATAALLAPRYYSMMHIAMFDAANAIARDYAQFRVRVRQASGSSEAAAAQAAHDILTALIGSKPEYDDLLARQLAESDGCPCHKDFRCWNRSGFVRRGAAVGAQVAKEILAWRQNDGWIPAVPPAPYVNPPFPGLWQLTPGITAATFTHLQSAAPMALLTSTQYLPPPPPALTSPAYATDFNEVKGIGKSDSATRTPLQTEIARLWAGVWATGTGTTTNLWAIWSNITRDVAIERGLSLVQAARLFALVHVSMHDGVHQTQTSKFVYGLWRPVTAIRNADLDPNDATTPDTTWLSLISNPSYPSYGGNMACVGASAATALQLAFGTNDIPVSATWRQTGGTGAITHNFDGLWQAAQEQAESRIYAGIHYRFDQVAGQNVGKKAAAFIFANYMGPRRSWDDD